MDIPVNGANGETNQPDARAGQKRLIGHSQRTCFDDFAPMPNVEMRCNEGDVGEVKDLSAVGECDGPKLRCRSENMNEPSARTRGDLGAVGDTDKVSLPEIAELCIEILARSDNKGLNLVSGLQRR